MTITESTTDTLEQIAAVNGEPESVEVVEAAQPTDAGETGEAEAKAAEPKEAEEAEGEKEGKRKGGFQRRIDQLTAEKRELEAKLAASGNPAAEPPPFVEKPVLTNFESYEAYSEALVDWKVGQREAAKAAEAEASKQGEQAAAVAAKWSEQQAEARSTYSDYDVVVAREDVPISQAMQQTILESERGADLAYWLGKNPEEARRIAGLGTVAAIRALGKVEDSLPAATQATTKPRPPQPPDPIRPVGGGRTTATKDPSAMDFKEFKAWREQGGGRQA